MFASNFCFWLNCGILQTTDNSDAGHHRQLVVLFIDVTDLGWIPQCI
jgi:hypothetical protein